MTAVAHGTAHSHWGLWGTWRRGPDVVGHVADVVADVVSPERKPVIRLLYRGDEEHLKSGPELEKSMTGQAAGSFDAILIEGGDEEQLLVRVAWVRRPTDVLIGARRAVPARVHAGVVMEAMSSDPERGDEVANAARKLTAAIERGRPRWVTRPARYGYSTRKDGASASRLLATQVLKWPSRVLFPVAFVLAAVALYIGAVVLLAHVSIPYKCPLDWGRSLTRWLALVVGIGVTIAAAIAQARLFPSVEVATLTSARRAARGITTASLSAAAGFVLSIPGLESLFQKTC